MLSEDGFFTLLVELEDWWHFLRSHEERQRPVLYLLSFGVVLGEGEMPIIMLEWPEQNDRWFPDVVSFGAPDLVSVSDDEREREHVLHLIAVLNQLGPGKEAVGEEAVLLNGRRTKIGSHEAILAAALVVAFKGGDPLDELVAGDVEVKRTRLELHIVDNFVLLKATSPILLLLPILEPGKFITDSKLLRNL